MCHARLASSSLIAKSLRSTLTLAGLYSGSSKNACNRLILTLPSPSNLKEWGSAKTVNCKEVKMVKMVKASRVDNLTPVALRKIWHTIICYVFVSKKSYLTATALPVGISNRLFIPIPLRPMSPDRSPFQQNSYRTNFHKRPPVRNPSYRSPILKKVLPNRCPQTKASQSDVYSNRNFF